MTAVNRDPTRYVLHRPPALCLDEVVAGGEESAECALVVRPGPFVRDGRFVETAYVEALAQTAAVMGSLRAERGSTRLVRGWLVGVRSFRILRGAGVGERITCRVRTVRRLPPLVLVEGVATSGDEILAAGELKFFEETAG